MGAALHQNFEHGISPGFNLGRVIDADPVVRLAVPLDADAGSPSIAQTSGDLEGSALHVPVGLGPAVGSGAFRSDPVPIGVSVLVCQLLKRSRN